ncbi:MAG: Smr/MutS family protein [Bacteroidota bacterium]|nr:Smr/MutS family protein [Bacteroidota bacterium]
MIYPQNFEDKIGFDKIREMLKDTCLCDLGRQKVEEIAFSPSFGNISKQLNLAEEFRQICLMEPNFPLQYFIDVTPALKRIRVVGTFLEINEIGDIRKSLESIHAILNFFKNKDESLYPNLRGLTRDIQSFPLILNRIDAILTKNGVIKDNASPELAAIRLSISEKASSIGRIMQRILKQAQSEGYIDEGTSLSMREGRAVIPMNSTYKRKVQGIVHDESATGKTSFIEPAETVEINNAIRELEFAERREIIKILTQFTDFTRPYLDELFMAYDFMADIDFIHAKAVFALRINAVKPAMFDQPGFRWEKAVHPLLFLTLSKENRSVVPLDINLDERGRILLISGPNAGGKSVCLKTTGLIQYMYQCGLLVPVSENSEMGIFDNLFIDIGDEQSIENDLSTYSSHLVNMKNFLKYATPKTLLLIDEFGTGTEPMLGGAIAEAILNQLNQKQVYGVITTHYTNLKHFASSADGIANGAMLYDAHRMQPLFKLQIGKPGSSFAFEIARKIGLPEEVLKEATDKVGQGHVDFEKNLRDIARDKRYWESKRDNIRLQEKRLAELVAKHQEDLSKTGTERKAILEKAKVEAREILLGANKQIENTIRQIKESQAEKEKTREVRKQLDEFKEKVETISNTDEERILRKIEKLKERENKIKKRNQPETMEPEETIEPEKSKIEVGDKVKLYGQETVGEVLSINGKNFLVAFGNITTSLPETRIEKISNNEFKRLGQIQNNPAVKAHFSTHERRLNFKPHIDVRGMRTEEAIEKVQDLVDEAVMLNISEVKILHGKGNGILRQMIREYLATLNFIKSFRDEHIEMGGTGITIVELE